jgi:hypothetical protein
MRPKIRIFEGNDAEKVAEEVNIFTAELDETSEESHFRSIKIIPMCTGGIVLMPTPAGLVTVPADGKTGGMAATAGTCVMYSIAVVWWE